MQFEMSVRRNLQQLLLLLTAQSASSENPKKIGHGRVYGLV